LFTNGTPSFLGEYHRCLGEGVGCSCPSRSFRREPPLFHHHPRESDGRDLFFFRPCPSFFVHHHPSSSRPLCVSLLATDRFVAGWWKCIPRARGRRRRRRSKEGGGSPACFLQKETDGEGTLHDLRGRKKRDDEGQGRGERLGRRWMGGDTPGEL